MARIRTTLRRSRAGSRSPVAARSLRSSSRTLAVVAVVEVVDSRAGSSSTSAMGTERRASYSATPTFPGPVSVSSHATSRLRIVHHHIAPCHIVAIQTSGLSVYLAQWYVVTAMRLVVMVASEKRGRNNCAYHYTNRSRYFQDSLQRAVAPKVFCVHVRLLLKLVRMDYGRRVLSVYRTRCGTDRTLYRHSL